MGIDYLLNEGAMDRAPNKIWQRSKSEHILPAGQGERGEGCKGEGETDRGVAQRAGKDQE